MQECFSLFLKKFVNGSIYIYIYGKNRSVFGQIFRCFSKTPYIYIYTCNIYNLLHSSTAFRKTLLNNNHLISSTASAFRLKRAVAKGLILEYIGNIPKRGDSQRRVSAREAARAGENFSSS